MPNDRDHPAIRIGHGYDLHRLAPLAEQSPDESPNPSVGESAGKGPATSGKDESPTPEHGKPLILCGVALDHDRGPVGHSDGDAGLHALTDAILGALGEPDIGESFPDTSPKWKHAESSIFLREAVARARAAGYSLGNVDLTIILERPKIQPHKDVMRVNISNLLEIPASRVNVKGKTHEKVDAVGEGRAIEAHAVVLLIERK